GDGKPHHRLCERLLRLRTVGDQIGASVAIDVADQHSVDAMDLIVNAMKHPLLPVRFTVGTLEPEAEPGVVPGPDKIGVSIAVDIHDFAVDTAVLRIIVDDDLCPVRRNKQAGLAAAVGDDVNVSVAGEIRGDGGHRVVSAVYDGLLPGALDDLAGLHRPPDCCRQKTAKSRQHAPGTEIPHGTPACRERIRRDHPASRSQLQCAAAGTASPKPQSEAATTGGWELPVGPVSSRRDDGRSEQLLNETACADDAERLLAANGHPMQCSF